MIWRCRDVTFPLTDRVLVMGIVNVTPDSFSDGGRYLDAGAAVARCHSCWPRALTCWIWAARARARARKPWRRASSGGGSSRC